MLFFLLALACFLYGTNSYKTNYTVGQANRFAELCLAAYCSGNLGSGATTWTCTACKKQPQMTKITQFYSSAYTYNANGYVGYDTIQKAIVVSFAGTDPLSITDWIDDIDFFATSYSPCKSSGCQVHQGFYKTYLSVQSQIQTAVKALWTTYGSSTNFQVTGHSLGGAMAAMCAIDFYVTYGVQPQYVYTFGEPRLGNQQFATYYNSKIHNHMRVTHRMDPVPHLPTQLMGFYHENREYFYASNPNGTYVICANGEDSSCSNQYLIDVNVADHLSYMGFDWTTNYLTCKF